MWMWLALALANSPDRFPVVAPVTLSASGVTAIEVPPDLRSTLDPHDGGDLMLVDAAGKKVPFAVLRSDDHREWVRGTQSRSGSDLSWWPLVASGTYQVRIGAPGIDALAVRLNEEPAAATVTVYEGDTVLVTADVWRVGDAISDPLPLPRSAQDLRVVVEGASGPVAASFDGFRYPTDARSLRRRVPAEPGELMEDGKVRYRIPEAAGLPVTAITLEPDHTLFDRSATARRYDPSQELYLDDLGRVQRMNLDGRSVEQLTLPLPEYDQGTEVAVFVDASNGPPLEIPFVTLHLAAVELLVRDPGAGPHQLYGGAPPGTAYQSDIQFAAAELGRAATSRVKPGTAAPNAAYEAPEVRGGLIQPTSTIPLRDFTAMQQVSGTGLVRIPLSAEVLATARPDLGDLRLVDAKGRQIPYITVPTAQDWSWGELPFERTERGDQSYLTVTLPQGNLEIGAVELTTDAPSFERRIELTSVSGARLETLRALTWRARDGALPVRFQVNKRLGDQLAVAIHNGDNPPLPIDSIRVSRASYDLIAYLPEGGATLYLGDPKLAAPSYDLTYDARGMLPRARVIAQTGPLEPMTPPPVSLVDSALVAGGVGTMALGLLGLMLVLLRGAPEEADEPVEAEEPESMPAPEADENPTGTEPPVESDST